MPRRPSCWKQSVGAYGHSVTVFERQPGGPLYLRWWDSAASRWAKRSLRHSDRGAGQAAAKKLAAELLAAINGARVGRLSPAEVFARYEREVSAHKKGAQPSEDRRRIAVWSAHLREIRDVRAIDAPTLDRFVRDRRAGRLVALNDDEEPIRLKKRPSDTTIGADLVFLNSVLNWACKLRTPDGFRLLTDNPMTGFAIPQNKNPRGPVATYDRYLKVREKADEADPQKLFGAFLDLVEALGWRVSAICQLVATDLDLKARPSAPNGRIRKRADADKEGVEMWVPLSSDARAAIDRIRRAKPAIGQRPLFPSPKARKRRAPKPWSRWHARDLLERAEEAAELDPLEGGDFHAYRRKWAVERKALPTADVAHAGGWRDVRSLERSYQRPDDATVLAVVTETRKLREMGGA
jgi:integrase